MHYILIAVMLMSNGVHTLTMQEFQTEFACLVAITKIQNATAGDKSVTLECVPYGS
jgi:hypothetical protein